MLKLTQADFQGFLEVWAIRHAEHAWRIYRGANNNPPPVVGLEVNIKSSTFEVCFEGGEIFEVEFSGNGRPKG